jgi:hypothetical protein
MISTESNKYYKTTINAACLCVPPNAFQADQTWLEGLQLKVAPSTSVAKENHSGRSANT